MANEYVVVDLETTGLDIEKEEIIEIAAVKVRRGLIVDQFSTLVACERPLNEEIVRLTGITEEMLLGQPGVQEAVAMFTEFAGDADLVAHNADFDGAFLRKYWPDPRIWLDTIVLAQIAFPCETSYSLANLTALLAIQNDDAHRALSDALATAKLFIKVNKALSALPPAAKEDILQLVIGDETPTGRLLARECALSGAVASTHEEEKKLAPRERRSVDESFQLDLHLLADYLGENSLYRNRIENFEKRPQQLKMAAAVGKALNTKRALLAEAGTGTGKSMAYLLPAALYAEGSGEPVAVSTHTRNLQEQLLNKDIPMLEKLLGRPVRAALVKGRGNYLCRRLYQYLLQHPPENLRYFLMRVASWRSSSKSGDSAELNLTSYDGWKWRRVCADRENCAPFCPFRRHNGCIVQRVRDEAARADIVVLNHSLLIANASVESGFLPELPNLIVDEAQHLEKAAEEGLTATMDIFAVLDLLSRLLRREKGRQVGALPLLRKYAAGLLPLSAAERAQSQLDDLEMAVDKVIAAAERFFDLLNGEFRSAVAAASFFPAKVRVTEARRQEDGWLLVQQAGDALAAELTRLAQDSFRLLDALAGENQAENAEKPAGSDELFGAGSYAREMVETLHTCLLGEDSNFVCWVEFPDVAKRPAIAIAPIELGSILNACLYQKTRSLVFTSATLAAGHDFSYFRQRTGLDLLPEKPVELMLDSPFYYRDQALFTIVNDLPDWSRCSELEAEEAISAALMQLLTASKGRAIVLFTSHHQLKAVFQRLRRPLQEQGMTLLAHGVSGAPSSLLERLKQEEKCCILGSNSFWEGVDVIGDALSLIVVVRLPFWPPNSPLTVARMEQLEASGGHPFRDYSLPQALIRFKQGFGRLIRSDRDCGAFCVLDRRIAEKYYGNAFIRCLPDLRRYIGSTEEMAGRIQQWLE